MLLQVKLFSVIVFSLIVMIPKTHGGGMGITYPGTKWCGPGNSAKNYDDLGENIAEDKCCRAHDNCDDHLLAGQELNCKCDKELKDCLKQVNTKLSNSIGNIYFSVQQTCYKLEYPVVGCEDPKSKKQYTSHRRSRRHLHELFNRVLRKISYKIELHSQLFASHSKPINRPCLHYKVDTTAPKKWQFLDMPPFNDDKQYQVFQFDDDQPSNASATLH
uniref:phospholipase A2 n=1 Tax=Culicoides sonorensis TaxID=179676 RepID=A0A336LVU0_CULSO